MTFCVAMNGLKKYTESYDIDFLFRNMKIGHIIRGYSPVMCPILSP